MPRPRGTSTSTSSPGRPLRPHLPRSAYHVLVAGELLHADRAAGVETVRGDADLGSHTELATIGELRRGVVQHDRAVDALQKALGGRRILGHDRLGVR